jgi:hypothetical protein
VSGLPATQLDLFLDSHAVVAANEIAAALLARDVVLASACLDNARRQGHEHPELPALATLTQALTEWRAPARDAPAIAEAAMRLDTEMVPAAASALGAQAPRLIAHFFAELAQSAQGLIYDPAYPDAHYAALSLRAGDADAAERAAMTIAGWTGLPDALYWVTVARYRLRGLEAARATLFAFAWRDPRRMERLLAQLQDEVLERDWRAFEAASDWESISELYLPAWFPAWYVMEHPAAALNLDPALLPDADAVPAAAARLLVHLLDLEKQGNSRALVTSRERLRRLNAEFFELYMARRKVRYG